MQHYTIEVSRDALRLMSRCVAGELATLTTPAQDIVVKLVLVDANDPYPPLTLSPEDQAT